MELLTADEIAVIMRYPPEARQHAWMTLLAQNRVTVDMIREAEGLEQKRIDVANYVRDKSQQATFGPEWTSQGMDLTDGSTAWAGRIAVAIYWTTFALGVVTLISLAGRAVRWLAPRKD